MIEEKRRVTNPVVFELIDKDGNRTGHISTEAHLLGQLANRVWPGMSQDEDRTGRGWDIEVVRPKKS